MLIESEEPLGMYKAELVALSCARSLTVPPSTVKSPPVTAIVSGYVLVEACRVPAAPVSEETFSVSAPPLLSVSTGVFVALA